MQFRNKLDARLLEGTAMIGSTNSSSSDGYALVGNTHSLGAGPTELWP
jgi:hypothetical protein